MNKRLFNPKAALKLLSSMDDDVKTAIETYGYPSDRSLPENFGSLARIIVGQQVSRSAATSIWKRLLEIDIEDSTIISEFKPEDMMMAGLSRRKSEYIIGIANEIVSGSLDLESLSNLHGEEVKERLISIRGVGAWTADNYRLFALGDMDAWPANDVALQGGMKIVKSLDDGADGLVLAGETAIGSYPIETVRILSQVINENEKNTPQRELERRMQGGEVID